MNQPTLVGYGQQTMGMVSPLIKGIAAIVFAACVYQVWSIINAKLNDKPIPDVLAENIGLVLAESDPLIHVIIFSTVAFFALSFIFTQLMQWALLALATITIIGAWGNDFKWENAKGTGNATLHTSQTQQARFQRDSFNNQPTKTKVMLTAAELAWCDEFTAGQYTDLDAATTAKAKSNCANGYYYK